MVDVIIIFILVAINGFFSLSEVALISARRSKLQSEAKAGSRAARAALELQDNPDKYLSTCQIGITVVSILTGIYSGERLADDFSYWLTSLGIAASLAPGISKTIIVIVATYLQVELGELFPKRIAIDLAEPLARAVAPFMLFLANVTKPVVWFLTVNTEILTKILHLHPTDQKVTEEEVKTIIEEGTRSGEVQEVEQDIMERVLFLGDQKVESLMTRLPDLKVLDVSMTCEEVERILHENSFANYPVVDGSMEHVVGIVSLKELVLIVGKPDFDLRSVTREPVYFPENMTVYKALEELKKSHLNCSLVCDEFGSIAGIIALKDILEGLVGSIDEPEDMPDIIEAKDKQSWVVSGQCLFYDFLEFFDMENDYNTEYTTVGGLILEELEHIPHEGERILWKNFSLQVLEMDGARIHKVLAKRLPPELDQEA